jgi:hypothetical protein
MMFIRPEQKELHSRLHSRSAMLGDIYLGGLLILLDEKNPTRYQLAAHSFRELLAKCPELTGNRVAYGDGMKQRLVPVRKAFTSLKQVFGTKPNPPNDDPANVRFLLVSLEEFFAWESSNRAAVRKKVAMVLAQLAGPGPALPSDIVEEEISAWMDSDDYFKLVAHHKTVAQPEEFVARLFSIENVLLRRLQPRPVSDLDEIDRLIREAEHDFSEEKIDQILDLVSKGAGNYEYFFSNLSNPAWMEPLAKRGRFSHPPPAERIGDGIRFPRWPEGEYLLRMAGITPEEVAKVIDQNAFDSDNHAIHHLLLEIGSYLAPAASKKIAEQEARWARKQQFLLSVYPDKSGPLIVYLAKSGEPTSALRLADAILEVRDHSTAVNPPVGDAEIPMWKLSPQPTAKIEYWSIQHFTAVRLSYRMLAASSSCATS